MYQYDTSSTCKEKRGSAGASGKRSKFKGEFATASSLSMAPHHVFVSKAKNRQDTYFVFLDKERENDEEEV